jgi:polygalacturonase
MSRKGEESMKSAHTIVSTILAVLYVVLTNIPTSHALAGRPSWEQADAIVRRIVVPTFGDRDFIITDFGAVPGGEILCTDALRKVVAACHEAGGGRVVVPSGRYLVGAIHLKSNVNLHVSQDAVLAFSQNPRDYLPVALTRWEGVECMNYSAFIYAFEQENIAVTGKGTLDGQADSTHWWPWKGRSEYGYEKGQPEQSSERKKMFDMGQRGVPVRDRIFGEGGYMRPNFIQTYHCKNVTMNGKLVNTIEDANKLPSIETIRSANASVIHVHQFPGPKVREGNSKVFPLYTGAVK